MEVTAITSVFVEGVLYGPGEKVKVTQEQSLGLLELGAIEVPQPKPAAKAAKTAE